MLKKSEYKKTEHKRRKNTSKNKRLSSQFNNFFTFETYKAFICLKNAFLKIPVFMHFDSSKFIRVKTNVFNKTLKVILCQQNKNNY